ncbi:MAG: ribonuclease P protein subunit [Candidatus Micrarchaeia archaeon]
MGKEIYATEYIGLRMTIVKSPSRNRIGISGKVIDETRNTFSIEQADGRVIRIPKKDSVFLFRKGDEKFEVDGNKIMYRPEDRTKKVFE